MFGKAAERSKSPSNSNGEGCDLSMDEGVKASNAHETMVRSPKTTGKDFKLSVMKPSEKKSAYNKANYKPE